MKQNVLQMLSFINKDSKKIEKVIMGLYRIIIKKIGKQKQGKKREFLPNMIAGIIYYLRTACTWRALPTIFGKYQTINGWFIRLSKLDIFKKGWTNIVAELLKKKKISLKRLLTDGSLTSLSGGGDLAKINPRNRNKKTINRIITTSGNGLPLSLLLVPGTAHDTNFLKPSIEQIKDNFGLPKKFTSHGDKGFDSFSNRIYISNLNGLANIAMRRQGQTAEMVSNKDKHRWKVERSIAWINRYQALANIYTRSLRGIEFLYHLSFILILSKKLSSKNLETALGAN